MDYSKQIDIKTDKTLGYQYFMDKQHPLSSRIGKVCYHRHVASLKVGHWLKSNEHVHHIDEDKCNNAADNLIILTEAEHARIHMPPLPDKKCPVCNKMFVPDKKQRKHCSVECANLGTRTVVRPDVETIRKEVKASGYCAVGRKYGVSDNAIRKWLK